jgi:hypothetical protein
MTAADGNTGNPFGNNAEIGVGFSDAALIAASVTGFLILMTTVYSIIVMRLRYFACSLRNQLEKPQNQYQNHHL